MYYIYRHIRLDKNEVFYIGKGSVDNKFSTFYGKHRRAYNKSNRNKIWKNITSKTDYKVEIIHWFDTEDECFKKEIELIALYGRKNNKTGILSNLTDGGEGVVGRVMSEEQKRLISEIQKKLNKGKDNYFYGKHFNGELNPFYGKKHTEETKLKHFIGSANHQYGKKGELSPNYGRKLSDETIEKIRQSRSGNIKVTYEDGSVDVFNSMSDICNYFKCSRSAVCRAINRIKDGNNATKGIFFKMKLERINTKNDKN